jgi:hypothetical protein
MASPRREGGTWRGRPAGASPGGRRGRVGHTLRHSRHDAPAARCAITEPTRGCRILSSYFRAATRNGAPSGPSGGDVHLAGRANLARRKQTHPPISQQQESTPLVVRTTGAPPRTLRRASASCARILTDSSRAGLSQPGAPHRGESDRGSYVDRLPSRLGSIGPSPQAAP